MILQLYILRQLVLAIGFSASAIGMVVISTVTAQALHKLGAVSLTAVLQYLPLVLIELVPYLLPVAFVLGVVSTYGRLAAERELIAIQMAGIHPFRVALPGVLIAAVLSIWTHHLLVSVSPEWKYRQKNFQASSHRKAFENFTQGRTEIAFGNSSLKAERTYGNVFEQVLLDLDGEDGQKHTVTAERAELVIEDDVLYVLMENINVLSEGASLENERPVWSRPMDQLFPSHPRERVEAKWLLNEDMVEQIESGELAPEVVVAFTFEMNRRLALSLSYFIFLLLGIPTGIVLRSSTQLGAFTGAVGYAFFYYVLMLRLGKSFALSETLPPVLSAWFTNILFLIVGATVYYRSILK